MSTVPERHLKKFVRVPSGVLGYVEYCQACDVMWPCDAIQQWERAEALEAQVAEFVAVMSLGEPSSFENEMYHLRECVLPQWKQAQARLANADSLLLQAHGVSVMARTRDGSALSKAIEQYLGTDAVPAIPVELPNSVRETEARLAEAMALNDTIRKDHCALRDYAEEQTKALAGAVRRANKIMSAKRSYDIKVDPVVQAEYEIAYSFIQWLAAQREEG